MTGKGEHKFDEKVLVRYLLGALPENDAELLDELSIADEAVAWRLRDVENDLLDSYVRGELAGDELARFRNVYLTSPDRLKRLEFARALSGIDGKAMAAAVPSTGANKVAGSTADRQSLKEKSSRNWFSIPQLKLQWGFAAIAICLAIATGYLTVENGRLSKKNAQVQDEHAALVQRMDGLQAQLNAQQPATGARDGELRLDQIKTISALIAPPMRGAERLPTISVPAHTDLVVLSLSLESDDFPAYSAKVRDSASEQVVWQSGELKSVTAGRASTVSISFPANSVQQRNYIVELSGISPTKQAEFISGYPVRFVMR
jgi:hypothetical protein